MRSRRSPIGRRFEYHRQFTRCLLVKVGFLSQINLTTEAHSKSDCVGARAVGLSHDTSKYNAIYSIGWRRRRSSTHLAKIEVQIIPLIPGLLGRKRQKNNNFCLVAQHHHAAIAEGVAPRNDTTVAEGVALPAGAELAMSLRRLHSMLAADSSQDDAAAILTTKVTAEGSEQQYKWFHYIPSQNFDGPGCDGRWEGRTVHGTVHDVYH